MLSKYEKILSGGHPNSLGNTVEVVSEILQNPSLFEDLFNTYPTKDLVVRLRISNAMKRIAKENPDLVAGYLDRFLDEITKLSTASTQWTLSQLFLMLQSYLTPTQKQRATTHMKKQLKNHEDWIVIAQTMNTLYEWSKKDLDLQKWLIPVLKQHSKDSRKSINNKAQKILDSLS